MNQPNRLKSWLTGKFGKEWSQTFQSLKNRDFRIYCTGQVVSLCGTWMQSIALSWLVWRLSGSATALGMVSFASTLPMLFLTYFGGMIADKFNRKTILYTTLVSAMIQAAVLTFLTWSGTVTVPIVVILAFVGGCITAIEMPTRQAFLADLVSKDELTNAIGLNSAIWNTSRTVGPALAGLLIGVFGEVVCFGTNAVSFLAALASLRLITLAPRVVNKDRTGAKNQTAGGKEETIWQVLMSPQVKYVMLLSAATSVFGFQYGVLLPVIVETILHGGAGTLGLLSAGAGIGALTGSLALASRGKSKFLRMFIGFTCMMLGAAIAVIATSPWLLVSLAAVAVAGACISLQLSGGTSLVQSVVEPSKRGRIMGVYSTFMIGFTPFAAMIAGWLAESIGVTFTLLISAASVFICAMIYLAFSRKIKDDAGDKK
jgi:MFS family permease